MAAAEAAQEYASTLADLTVNSKPLINMLTILAEENLHHASAIVAAVEQHLLKVAPEYKLPVLYLIDSIVKNVGRAYAEHFTQNIVTTFCSVFEKVDERTRAQMFKLRHTWNEAFPAKKLYAIDVRVQSIDPAWPIAEATASVSIHVNPKFLTKKNEEENAVLAKAPVTLKPAPVPIDVAAAVQLASSSDMETSRIAEVRMREELLRKQKELLELQQKKIELELLQTKTRLEEQQRQNAAQAAAAAALTSDPLKMQEMLLRQLQAQARLLAEQQKTNLLHLPVVSQPSAGALKPSAPSTAQGAVRATTLPQASTDGTGRAAAAASDPRLRPSILLKPSAAAFNASISSTSNKDFKAGIKDTSLSKDPRLSNKRISPVPRSMGMMAMSNRVMLGNSVSDFALTRPEPVIPKPEPVKHEPTTNNSGPFRAGSKSVRPSSSPVRSKKPSPAKTPERPSSPSLPVFKTSSKESEGKSSPRKGSITKTKPTTPSKSDSKVDRIANSKKTIKSSPDSKAKVVSKTKEIRKVETGSTKKYRAKEGGSKVSPKKKAADNVKSGRVFKEVKGCRSRNYVRRNTRSVSKSPEPPIADVDLRAPPDIKIPRIKNTTTAMQQLFADEPDVPNSSAQPGISPPFQLEAGMSSEDSSPTKLAAGGKDVDLRQLPTSPPVAKKRSGSEEKSDHPSPKKSKAEMIDVLFGSEDVDLRQLPPPPPTISTEEQKELKKAPDWARFKEAKPDTYRSPLKNCNWETSSEAESHTSEVGELPPPPPPPNKLLASPTDLPNSGFDRLGRPLLYSRNNSINHDPRERRLSSQSGEDTDMRHDQSLGDETKPMDPACIDAIVKQADQQLQDGTLTLHEYNNLLKQMVHQNEVNKMREAQRREEESFWDHSGSDPSMSPDDSRDEGLGSPSRRDYRGYDHEDGTDGGGGATRPFPKQGDIDERYHSDGPSGHVARGRGMPYRGGYPPRGAPISRSWVPGGSWEQPDNSNWQHPRHMGPRMAGGPQQFRPRGGEFPPRFPNQWGGGARPAFPFNPEYPQHRFYHRGELPPADPRVLEQIDADTMRTITIDGIAREIRFYGDTAIVMVQWDDPRELSFQPGSRRILINERDSYVLNFNDPPREVMVDGQRLSIKLGAPTRELMINGRGYECMFGGPALQVDISGQMLSFKLEGPAPQVSVGKTSRRDLVVGKINVCIDGGHSWVPFYLDAKPQKLVIDGKPHILRFVDSLATVLINSKPFKPSYGGLPIPLVVHGDKHWLAFSLLPQGVRPGFVNIVNMEGCKGSSSPREDRFPPAQPQLPPQASQPPGPQAAPQPQLVKPEIPELEDNKPAMPMFGSSSHARSKNLPATTGKQGSDKQQQQQAQRAGQRGGGCVLGAANLEVLPSSAGQLDLLTNLMAGGPATAASTGFDYQVQPEPASQDGDAKPVIIPGVNSFNLGDLMQKLVASGILQPSGDGTAEVKREEDSKVVKPITLTAESLKTRQTGVYSVLYSGIQCSSCGVRFPPEQTIKYSQHLDWHFRQNRRDRDSAKKAQSRKWYYDVSDWILFEEIEDLEDKAKSWFETIEEERAEQERGEQEVPSVPAGENSEDEVCVMCHDGFKSFYNEDKEEWHLRDAIRVEDKIYHSICYEDFQKNESMDDSIIPAEEEEKGAEAAAEPKDQEMKEDEETPKETPADAEEAPGDAAEPVAKSEAAAEEGTETKPEDDATAAAEEGQSNVVVKEEPIEFSETPTTADEPMDTSEPAEVKGEPVEAALNTDESVQSVGDVVIKTEPQEEEEEAPEPSVATQADTTLNVVTSSIDGNVELEESTPVTLPAAKIKINISKPIAPAPVPRVEPTSDTETNSVKPTPPPSSKGGEEFDEDAVQPPPPGEQDLQLKPKLVGRKLTEMPPKMKGTELSGLCSIM